MTQQFNYPKQVRFIGWFLTVAGGGLWLLLLLGVWASGEMGEVERPLLGFAVLALVFSVTGGLYITWTADHGVEFFSLPDAFT